MTVSTSSSSKQQLAQARLFAEVARRVDRPFDALSGDVSEVSLLLWQRAAKWAISAAETGAASQPAASTPIDAQDLLQQAAGGPELLVVIRELLSREATTTEPMPKGADVRAATLAAFTTRLIAELERPARDTTRWRLVRTARIAAGIFVVGSLLWLGLSYSLRSPNLVPSAQRTLSSQIVDCAGGACGSAIFHTNDEVHPWVRYDFGSPRQLHSVSVENRTDCCTERAVPLVVETSDDAKSWTERVRTDVPFVHWSSSLDARARYVRLRIDGRSILHLNEVVIR
ncbi:MAG TPA: discoidin domain-containing protein [Polyangiaceae bacterium]|nr:discoidin domain-containing protein [Polyangiaceae bacterium]